MDSLVRQSPNMRTPIVVQRQVHMGRFAEEKWLFVDCFCKVYKQNISLRYIYSP